MKKDVNMHVRMFRVFACMVTLLGAIGTTALAANIDPVEKLAWSSPSQSISRNVGLPGHQSPALVPGHGDRRGFQPMKSSSAASPPNCFS